MQQEILWRGLDDLSLEHCTIKTSVAGIAVSAVITGQSESSLYHAFYTIELSPDWHIRSFDITSQVDGKRWMQDFRKEENGVWTSNGKEQESLRHCIDIDISLTPFTNTLPINRLKLKENEEQIIDVVYINVTEQQIRPMKQSYKRLSAVEYLYRNMPSGFQAEIKTDASGLVTEYPGLFERVAIHDF